MHNIRLIMFFFLLSPLIGSAQKDVTIPEISGLDAGNGDQSSVNQSNGKLSLTLNLISLQGYNDLNASFGIGYDGANVIKNAKASSEYSPTGVMGLGWGMQFSRILVDNKLTATRDDDSFYIFESGSLNELRAISKTSTTISFELTMHKPWKVIYYTSQEKWEIIKENGYTYTYDNVDWVIHWDNWIGNSNSSGGARQGSSWNLTEVKDLYGNKVTYEYQNIEQSLKNTGGLKHTEATYLDKIIGPLGEEIRFVYGDKQSGEYFEPNTDQAEPDAYQEVYDRKYLNEVQAYDSNGVLLYRYDFEYNTINSGLQRKRLLHKVLLINSANEQQVFREFQYDTNPDSEFFGALLHQILPTKGRISYQYAMQEVAVDQIFEISASDNTSFIVQKDYILKLTGTNQLYLLTWNGQTWQEELFHSMPSGGVIDDLLNIHIVAKEDYFAVLHPAPGVDQIFLAGLKENRKTWVTATIPFHHPGVSQFLELTLFGNENFCAVGNPKQDRINFYRWDGNSWNTENIYNNTPGNYYYTSANNYMIQHNKDTSPDTIKLFYFDITGALQMNTLNASLETSSSGNYDSFWYGQNSFALVNANANPEYVLRWDKNYNYIGKEAPFGSDIDHITTFSFFNNYFANTKEAIEDDQICSGSAKSRVFRYNGNGLWRNIEVFSAKYDEDWLKMGFGNDAFVLPENCLFGDSKFYVFNANTSNWEIRNFPSSSTVANNHKASYDFFGNRHAFANRKLYRIDQDLDVSFLDTFPNNTAMTKSDGGNLLYLSSTGPNGIAGTPFSRFISIQRSNEIYEYNFPNPLSNPLWKNPYKNFPVYAIGYGTMITRGVGTNTAKIYRTIDGKIESNANGQTIYRDAVIAKETYDPVISRKQRNYYCYANPKMTIGNKGVTYQYVSQFNDIDAILGKTVTSYDQGETDNRLVGLPKKIRVFDANGNLVSEQTNSWEVIDVAERYYINLVSKENISYEGTSAIGTFETYAYDFSTGLLKETSIQDSEGILEVTKNTYLHEVYPEALSYNLLAPLAYTQSYAVLEDESKVYKNATAVEWDFTGIPHPKNSYAWNGQGTNNPTYNFDGGNPNFREAQHIDRIDTYGNIIEETNRSEVITSYIYGYQGKRLVAKIEGATYNQAISHIDNMSIINDPLNDVQLKNEIQKIRDGLPNAYVSSYTHHPSVGATSESDIRGRTVYYEFDNFYRLHNVKDNEGNILKTTHYSYREAPFSYSTESTDLPDCMSGGAPDGDPTDPTDPDFEEPLTLTLVKIASSGNDVLFEVIPSGGSGSTPSYSWSYSAIQGNVLHFPYTVFGTNNSRLSSTNPNCNEGILSVSVSVQVSNEDGTTSTVVSNVLNHTYTSGPECGVQ